MEHTIVNVLFSALTPAHKNITFAVSTLKQKSYAERKSQLLGSLRLYQLCSETKDRKDFCSEYGVNYDSHLITSSRTAGCRSQTISVNRE